MSKAYGDIMAKLHAMDTREYRDYNYLKTAQDSICQQVKEITSAFHTIQRSLIDIKCYNQVGSDEFWILNVSLTCLLTTF